MITTYTITRVSIVCLDGGELTMSTTISGMERRMRVDFTISQAAYRRQMLTELGGQYLHGRRSLIQSRMVHTVTIHKEIS